MLDLANKKVLVIGLGNRGRAVCGLLLRAGAEVTGVDKQDNKILRDAVSELREKARIELGESSVPKGNFDLAVISPSVPQFSPVLAALAEKNIPVLGELELAFQQSKCLNIAVAGTNGKSTTSELIERLLVNQNRNVVRAGHGARPACSVSDQTADLDYLVLQVDAFELESANFFRSAVAVLLNLAPDHLNRYETQADYIRANARLFRNQQAFDWAIVQTEALEQLKALNLLPESKVVTFSATNSESDIYLDRGLIISRLPNWSGPLLDAAQCQLRGPHNAENLMAALAVGHALRLPLEQMVETLKIQTHGAHRFEIVAEINGVQFINDSKARNVNAMQNALLAARPGEAGKPNVWLIAGGKDKELDFHAVGPVISQRVKGAFLIGEAREKIRSAWSLFTPCTLPDSLLEAVTEAAKNAAPGDVVLLSPACSSFDQFQNYQQRGERFCQIVKSISRGEHEANPNINDKSATT
jgi:UDP-N-acetylmuramoylalanine--D-glutamate ligase